MKRRDFIKLSFAAGFALILPSQAEAGSPSLNNINFNNGVYSNNNAQTIIIFLYGAASPLAGNLTNLDEIEEHSYSSYADYFQTHIKKTENGFWEEAGGVELEELLQSGDMTLFRTCYSDIREKGGNKSHGLCVEQNMKGSFDVSGNGVLTNIANVLNSHGIISENTKMPLVTMEGESYFYSSNDKNIPSYLRPTALNRSFTNPYTRGGVRSWLYYRSEEIQGKPNYYKSDSEGGFDPELTKTMDTVSMRHSSNKKIINNFKQREKISKSISTLKDLEVPDLGDDEYTEDSFSQSLKAAVKTLAGNPETKAVTLNTGGLGGWDDHNEGNNYIVRSQKLFKAIKSAAAHLRAINKIDTINIMVFSEFGRNVNLNPAHGWDHGNLQNLYVIGGNKYFNHKGIVGQTQLDVQIEKARLWLKPADNSYWFEPISIASTLYKIYGIENPEVLTGGNYEPLNILS